MDLLIREEKPDDQAAIREIVKHAFEQEFGSSDEIGLIKELQDLDDYDPDLSFVAVSDGEVVGYLLLFPVQILTGSEEADSLSLGPMAVDVNCQGKGIGSQLIQHGLKKAKEYDYESVVVLGHPDYYPKFGFQPASNWKIKAPFEGIPDHLFFALELVPDALEDISGTVKYPKPYFEMV